MRISDWSSDVCSSDLDPTVILLLMLGIFIAAGCVMETTPNIVILAPIMLPLAENIGMNDIHFCIFMVTALGVGFVTPPLGLNLFVLAGLTGESVMRSEEHTSELQTIMRISYAVFCLKKQTM